MNTSVSGNLLIPKDDYSISISTIRKLFQENKLDQALIAARELSTKYPSKYAPLYYMGLSALRLDLDSFALACFMKGLEIENNSPTLFWALGEYFKKKNDINQAINYYRLALAQPAVEGKHDIFLNTAAIFFDWGLFKEAKYCIEKAIALKNEHKDHFIYACILLATQDYTNGWKEFEYRLYFTGKNYNKLKLTTPIWNGQDDLNNKTIVIKCEQGLGDNIQFVRFVPLLKKLYPTVTVILTCPAALYTLFNQIKGVDTLLCTKEIPKQDYYIPLPSLPFVLKIHNESQLKSPPYLKADVNRIHYWQKKLAQNKPKIGFCWAGNPEHINNARRNCPLENFLTLKLNSDVTWYSLQKNLSKEESELLTYANIHNLNEQLNDFNDTLAVIHELDIVISIDSAIAHLAGAAGKKVLLILNYETEWRHPRHVSHSPWYPSVKLLRQASPGNWDSVFRLLEEEIKLL